MHFLVTIVTAAAFVLHFTLGCCAHHAHAAVGTVCLSHAKVSLHAHDHDGHDHQSQEPCEQSPGCPSEQCDDGHCVFAVGGKAVEVNDAVAVVSPVTPAELACLEQISPLAAVAIDSGGLIALPMRTHLFNQVLLI